ncbi:MAG: AEC family transporter [Rubellimicrobium sp.]|nr:AEC family transporter [Rubellimicrobium sp.]
MLHLATAILPVFLVVAAGYAAAWRGFLSEAHVDGLMRFGQGIAIPLLLFRAMAGLDLRSGFDPGILGAYYTGATTGFLAGLTGARVLFRRDWEDAVAIGFVGLFSNTLLLGLPITARAFGGETALAGNFVIIAIHSPFCYGLGIAAMEIARAHGTGLAKGRLVLRILRAVLSNTLVLGILAGLAFNLVGLALPEPVMAAVNMVADAGIPAALFGLGGILLRYRPEGDRMTILYITTVALVLHPAITFGLAHLFGVPAPGMRSAVVTAAMAPGINAYLFADMYGRARRVAASAVLAGTIASVVTAAFWIAVLP